MRPLIALLLLLLLSTLALTTTAAALPTLGSSPAKPPPSPSPQPTPSQHPTKTYKPNYLTRLITKKLSAARKWMSKKHPAPPPQPPSSQGLTKTHKPNYLTRLITKKLSAARKWMSKKPPAPPLAPPLAPPPQPASSAIVRATHPANRRPLYIDPANFQRFVQELHANRRPRQLGRRGVRWNSESLRQPRLETVAEAVEPKELTEAEFDAMFEEYRLKHDIAVGLPPKGQRQKKWEGTKFGGYIEKLMGVPGRGVPQ